MAAPDHLLVFLVLLFAYHFLFEARSGQTPGKRRYGIRVESVDGGLARPQAVAIRSALRIVDQLPLWYVSGLISMVRTGPARRQRIGDVAAGTRVVAIDGRAAARGTPGWLLPTATLLAAVVSAAVVYGVAEAGTQTVTASQSAEFVANCQHSAVGQFIDCRCFLSRLEAAGYDTSASLSNLGEQAREDVLAGRPSTASRALASAFAACRT